MPNGTLDGFNYVLNFDEGFTHVFRVSAIVFLHQSFHDVASVRNLSISCCDQLSNVLVILSHCGGLLLIDLLMPPRIDKETENSFFTERFGGFQSMQAFNEHESSAVRPYQDRRLLALVEHARGDFGYALLIKGGTPLDWHVDVCDRDGLAPHHAGLSFISFLPPAVVVGSRLRAADWSTADRA